jgi:hypothetical protein
MPATRGGRLWRAAAQEGSVLGLLIAYVLPEFVTL